MLVWVTSSFSCITRLPWTWKSWWEEKQMFWKHFFFNLLKWRRLELFIKIMELVMEWVALKYCRRTSKRFWSQFSAPTFLWVCVSSLCMCGFSPRPPVSSYSSKTSLWGELISLNCLSSPAMGWRPCRGWTLDSWKRLKLTPATQN